MAQGSGGQSGSRSSGFLGSLKDALVAASRDDHLSAKAIDPAAGTARPSPRESGPAMSPPPVPQKPVADAMASDTRKSDREATQPMRKDVPVTPSAADAARDVKAQASLKDASLKAVDRTPERHLETNAAPTTRVLKAVAEKPAEDPAKTQLVRGRQALKRGEFALDPVVGWLVVVGGPGLGSYRPVFEGNNTVGRAPTNRVALDFGDAAISSEEQAYIRYDAADRSFLFVPNMSKTNVVSVNDKRPTGAVVLENMDVIVMGRTQLVFVPFCGPEFDWSEIAENKA